MLVTLQNGITISTNKALLDIAMIHDYLANQSYWAANIPITIVESSIAHSLCFGVFAADEKQIGFARVVTDYSTFAYLCDVFILPAHQGKGIGKQLIATIHQHPNLQGLRRWMLATKDAYGLYEQAGWKHLSKEQAGRILTVHQPDLYKVKGEK